MISKVVGEIKIKWFCIVAGMVQLEFQLHDEPEMGFYQINMRRNGKNVQARFEVKEYGKLPVSVSTVFLLINNYYISA